MENGTIVPISSIYVELPMAPPTQGNAEVPVERVSTDSNDISTRVELQRSAKRNKRLTPPEKHQVTFFEHVADRIPDETEKDPSCENENRKGNSQKKAKKLRSMSDLLGDQGNLIVKTIEENSTTSPPSLESARSRNAVEKNQVVFEKTNDPSGKAILVRDISASELNVVSPAAESLLIGTKNERLRRRNPITPLVSKKYSKPSGATDFSATGSSLVRSLPASSVAEIWGSHPSTEQRDQPPLLESAGLNNEPSLNSSSKVGLDLSLGSFARGNHFQDSERKGYPQKDNTLFGKSISGPILDLNKRVGLIPYNLEANKFPEHIEKDFLKLGLGKKSIDHENQKEVEDKNFNADVIPSLRRPSDMTSLSVDGQLPATMKNLGRGYPGLHTIPPFKTPIGASLAIGNGRMHPGSFVTLPHLIKDHIKLFQTEGIQKGNYNILVQNQQGPYNGMQIFPSASVGDALHHPQALEQTFEFGIQQNQASDHHRGITVSEIKKLEEPKQPLDTYMYAKENHHVFNRNEQQELMNGSLLLRQSLNKAPPSLGSTLSSCQSLTPYSASNQLSLFSLVEEISQNPGSSAGAGPSSSRGKGKLKAITDSANTLALPHASPPRYQRHVNPTQPISEAIVVPSRPRSGRLSSPEEVCNINKNPAELPESSDRDKYYITGKDLKPRKKKYNASTSTNNSNSQRIKNARLGN